MFKTMYSCVTCSIKNMEEQEYIKHLREVHEVDEDNYFHRKNLVGVIESGSTRREIYDSSIVSVHPKIKGTYIVESERK